MSRQKFDTKNRAGDLVSASALNEFRREMRRNRVKVAPTSQTHQSPGGLLVNPPGGTTTRYRIKTTGTITARSGTTPGSGSAVVVLYNGSALSDGRAITLLNVYGTAGASGKYGFADLIEGRYWLVNLEC